MNTKRKSKKIKTENRSTGSKLISMLLLLFISVVGLYISRNMICYIGIIYSIAKMIIVLRPTIKRMFHETKLTWGFKILYGLLLVCLTSLFIGVYQKNVMFVFVMFMVTLYLACSLMMKYKKELLILQKIIQDKIMEIIHETFGF